MRHKLLISSLLLISGLTYGKQIEISTSPKSADVFVRNTETGKRFLVGKTPYTSSFSALEESYKIKGNFAVEIQKPGYENYNIFITRLKKSKIKITTTLSLKSTDIASSINKFDNVINKLFDAQRFVRSKGYNQALDVLKTIEDDARYLSSYYEIKAGTLYLKKDFNGALANYRKAYSLNEDNLDVFSMKKYLEKTLGSKK